MLRRFIERLKLPFRKDRELRSALYRILGFYPHNIEYYKIAFAHKSQAFRDKKGQLLNNERLEFLGDAVLESVVSDILFHHFEKKHEGFLTSTRSKIVQRESLNKLAKDLGIDKLVQVSTRNNSHNSHIGGNAFEALMGAVYLDKGYKTCQRFIRKQILGRIMDLDGVANKEVNFKSKLLEWCQKNKIHNDFAMTMEESAKQNEPIFHCTVIIEGIEFGYGKGYSKKEAQQAAAKETLTILRRDENAVDGVFRSKEKRTAMEANEVAVLPKIEEIEEALQQEKQQGKKTSAPPPAAETPKKKELPQREEVRVEKKEQPAKPANTPSAKEVVKEAKPEKLAITEKPAEASAEKPAKLAKATPVVIAEAAIADAESRMYPLVETPKRNKLPAVKQPQIELKPLAQNAEEAKEESKEVPTSSEELKQTPKKQRRKKHQVHALEEFTQPKSAPAEVIPENEASSADEPKEEKLSRRARRAAKLAKSQLANAEADKPEGNHVQANQPVAHNEAQPLNVEAKDVKSDTADAEAKVASNEQEPKISRAERRRNKRKQSAAESKTTGESAVTNTEPAAATQKTEDNTLAKIEAPKTDTPAAAPRKKHQSGNSRMRRKMQARNANQDATPANEAND